MDLKFCIFYNEKILHFGMIVNYEKNYYQIIYADGIKISCLKFQIKHIWNDESIVQACKKTINEKELFLKACEQLKQSQKLIDIDKIYSALDKNQPYTAQEILKLAKLEISNWLIAALLVKLKEVQPLFFFHKNNILARDETSIRILKDLQENQKQKDLTKDLERYWIDALLSGQSLSLDIISSNEFKNFTKRLLNFAIHPELSFERKYYCELLGYSINQDNFIIEHKVSEILQKAGLSITWQDIVLKRIPCTQAPNSQVSKAAELLEKKIYNTKINDLKIKDHSNLLSYTVDNYDTKDFDDAVSLDVRASDTYVLLHITDVSHYINKNSELFNHSRKLFSSLYIPQKVYNMLPDNLAEEALSLKKHKKKLVITFSWQIDKDFRVKKFCIYPSIIKVAHNFTYNEIDDLLENHDYVWQTIKNFCFCMREKRLQNGATNFNRSEPIFEIDKNEIITLKMIKNTTTASLIIEELAIQANFMSGILIGEKNYPAIFRSQQKRYNQFKVDNYALSKSHTKINFLKKATFSAKAFPHEGLAIKAYAQVTSPLRKFSNLINQMQLKAALGFQPINFTDKEIIELVTEITSKTKIYSQIEKSILKHIKYCYLAQNIGVVFDITIIKNIPGGQFLINFEKIQLLSHAHFKKAYDLPSSLKVKLTEVDIENRHIKIELA